MKSIIPFIVMSFKEKIKKKKKILIPLLGLALLNSGFSFYLVFGDAKLNLKILEPVIKIYTNIKEGTTGSYQSSDDFEVVNKQELTEDGLKINKELNRKRGYVIPIQVDGNLLENEDVKLNLKYYSLQKNASNLFEVWLAKVENNNNCPENTTKLGSVKEQGHGDDKFAVCGMIKLNDKDENSEYFNTLYLNKTVLENYEYVTVIRFNPMYKGAINITIVPEFTEYLKSN